jgi:hypothetical protein
MVHAKISGHRARPGQQYCGKVESAKIPPAIVEPCQMLNAKFQTNHQYPQKAWEFEILQLLIGTRSCKLF